MENLLFWVLPVLFLLCGLKGRLVSGWRLFFCSAAALYLGFWLAPSWYNRLDFLPAAVAGYRFGIAVAFGFAFVFAALQCISVKLAGKDENFSFPVLPMRLLNAACRFGFGVVLSTLLYTLCATTPLRGYVRLNGNGVQAGANFAMFNFTAFCDRLTRFTPETPRAEQLDRLWYTQEHDDGEDRDETAEDEHADAPDKASGEAAAAPDAAQPPTK